MRGKDRRTAAGLAATLLLSACADKGAPHTDDSMVIKEYAPIYYDGADDDLLTGGLGFDGLNQTAAPSGASLRTKAIHTNFRAIIDVSEAGGFTRLYGPAKDALKIPGTEYVALLALEGLRHPFAVAVAIPDSFDADDPCLILAPASGSRGLYGAIGPAGLAGFPRGCAIAFTDKATGTGFVHLETGEGYGADLAPTGDAGEMLFSLTDEERTAAAGGPGAVAVKHAHSKENVERIWGLVTLRAGEYALSVLSRHFEGKTFTPATTRVLAVGISNGGKAAVTAAEADRSGLLDGVVASEPVLTLRTPGRVVFGGREIAAAGRPLYDYATLMNLYAPCAALAPELAAQPGAAATAFAAPALEAWCARLRSEGLVEGETIAEQGASALAAIRAAGFAPDADPLLHYGVAVRLWPATAAAYANAYGRYGPGEAPCGAFFAFASNGEPRAPTPEEKAALATLSSGIPPTGGVDVLYKERSADAAFNAALCLRRLWEGDDDRVRAGVGEAMNTGDHGGIPMILLHGRADSLIPVNHATRAYVAAAKGEGPLRYYEIEGGQHFDAFLTLPDLGALYSPMQPYLERSLDLMLAHLKTGAGLPPSQVVRDLPRGAGGRLGEEHLGSIRSDPGADAIEVRDGAVHIPG